MNEIVKFNKAPKFQVIIEANPLIISLIRQYAKLITKDAEYDWKTRTRRWNTVEHYFTESLTSVTLIMAQGVAKLIYDHILSKKLVFTSPVDVVLDEELTRRWIDTSRRITITDKWKTIFSNNPKGDARAQMQLEDSAQITKSNYGMISLFTGYGKTEMLLSLADSYLSCFDGNVVINCFSNKVRDEIILRAAKYGIKLTANFNMESRINVVNGTSFMRSNTSKNPKTLEWLSKVECFISDEAHHFTAQSWRNLVELCDPYFSYGMSASADIEEGVEFTPEKLLFSNSTPQMLYTFAYTGYFLVHRELEVPIRVFRKKVKISTYESIEYIKNRYPTYLIKMVNDFVSNPETAKVIAEIYKSYLNTGICYIPITTVESGMSLTTSLNKLGIKTVFWSGELAAVPGPDNTTFEANEEFRLETLKELARDRSFDVLVTTTVGTEGIDLPNLNSVIPLTGNSFKMMIQPLGRAARGDAVNCVFIWDEHNSVLNKQMSSKYKLAKNRLNVVSNRAI